MKKLIILILLVPLIGVEAKTYYTDYNLVEENSKEFKEESNTLKREEIKLYNTYEKEIKELGYEEECNNYMKDKYVEETIITKDKLNETSELYQSFQYQNINLHAFMIRSIKEDIKIKELKIKNNGGEVPYILVDANISNKEYMYDNDLNTEVNITTSDTFTIQLKELTNVNNLLIEFISNDSFETNIIFILKDTKFNYIQSYINTNNINFKDEDTIYKLIDITGFYDNTSIVKPYYKSKIKKYMCYEEVIKPLNIYVLSGNNINKEDYEIRYNYYKRDYLKVSDKTLTKKSNLKSLILDTSLDTNNLEIDSNINFDKSGTYEIEYKFKDKVFKHNIKYKKEVTSTTKKIPSTKYIEENNICICKSNNKYILYYRLALIVIIILFILLIKQKIRNN